MHRPLLTKTQVDYDKLAGLCSYTNPRSATNAWTGIKKKLTNIAKESAGDAGSTATPATPKSNKRAKTQVDDETPAKKPRSAKAAKVTKEEVLDAAEEGVTPAKKSTKPKTTKVKEETPGADADEVNDFFEPDYVAVDHFDAEY